MFWTCPKCKREYFLLPVEELTQDLQCGKCDDYIDGCKLCRDIDHCEECWPTDSSSIPLVLATDESACFTKPANCNSDTAQLIPRSVDFEGDIYPFLECPLCSTGYFWKNNTNGTEGSCTLCTTIDPDCGYCTNDGKC